MIIDCHGHTSAPQELYAYNYRLMVNRGEYGKGKPMPDDEAIGNAMARHIKLLDDYGIDIQLTPPRPWGLPHAETNEKIVRWMAEAVNDVIARQVELHPDRFRGMAGLPQLAGVSPANCTEELQRCVTELGFVGCMINPDPSEGKGTTPSMGDEFWYPLYEKMVELDAPALVHTGNVNNGRAIQGEHFITEETIAALSILRSRVLDDFPGIKFIIAHGGGAVPYQAGRWRLARPYTRNAPDGETFDDRLRKLYFDTVLYAQEPIELLIKTVGVDNCLFATDTPGSGTAINPRTNRPGDDLKPVIEQIEWLNDDDRRKIFEDNAKRVFTRLAKGKG